MTRKILILVALMLGIMGCSGHYWHHSVKTASGLHDVYLPEWGGGAPTYDKPQYIKANNYQRYAAYRHKWPRQSLPEWWYLLWHDF